ncbi:MAG: hypothetical protein HXM60_06270, partial [Megasphaera micronuciformis]|nr:hypothetical protein [Megasphaera micronuciformis]
FLYHVQVTYNRPVPPAEDRLQGAKESYADIDSPGEVVEEAESRDVPTIGRKEGETEE